MREAFRSPRWLPDLHASLCRTPSVRRWTLDLVDDNVLAWRLNLFEAQSKLFFESRHNVWGFRFAWSLRQAAASTAQGTKRSLVRRKFEHEIEERATRNLCPIDDPAP